VGIFLKEEAFKQADWIVNNLGATVDPAVVTVYPSEEANIIDIIVSLHAPEFPVTSFAKKCRLDRIIEREIAKMSLLFFAGKQVIVKEKEFFDVFCRDMRECGVAILDACFKNKQSNDWPLAILPAMVDVRESSRGYVSM
jgi:hypothetical protein